MGDLILLIVLAILATPLFIVIHIYRRLSDLRNRIEENFANDQAEKHVIRRALERLNQLEATVRQLESEKGFSGQRTPGVTHSEPIGQARGASPGAASTITPDPSSAQPETITELPPLPPLPPVAATQKSVGSSSDNRHEPVTADQVQLKPLATVDSAVLKTSPRATTTFEQPGHSSHTISATPQEWEAMIGGNLLNKLGAFILVIGLGLFLYYTLDSFGPFAKLFIGFLVGSALLAGSTFAERWDQDPLFIRGLFGAGWASLYFTAYAAHGLQATRVIDSPVAAGALLLVTAAGMVAHSLHFASESTTGLAFLIAFVGMVIGPESGFTNFATLVLVSGLLFLSYRFAWSHLALAGIFLGYGLHFFHPVTGLGEGLVAGTTRTLPVANNILLCIYWLGFELTAIVTAWRHTVPGQIRGAQFLGNAGGFFLVSYLLRPIPPQGGEYVLWAEMAAFYLLSGYLRYSLFPARTNQDDSPEDAWFGNSESALCASVIATVLLVWYLLPATLVCIGWGVISLLVIEIGLRLPFPQLRNLGHLAAILAFGRVFMANLSIDGHTAGISHRLLTILPLVALYLQIFLRHAEDGISRNSTDGQRLITRAYLYFPVILLAVLARFELGRGLATPVWAGMALILQLMGRHFQLIDLQRQSIILGLFTALHGWGTDLRSLEASGWTANSPFIGGLTILLLFVCEAVTPREPPWREQEFEGAPTGIGNLLENKGRLLFSLSASFLLAFLLYLEISGSLLSMAWAFQGGLLLVLGFALREKPARQSGLLLLFLCLAKLFFHDLQNLDVPFRILSFVVLGLLLLGISWFYSRYQEKIKEYL